MPDKAKAVPILEKRSGTNVMRARDVVASLQNRNLDPILVDHIAKIAEINHTNCLAIAELATMFDHMVDTMKSFADVAQNMKDKAEQLERGTKAEVEGDEGAIN